MEGDEDRSKIKKQNFFFKKRKKGQVMQMIVHSTASHQSTSSKKKAFYDKKNKDFHGLKGNRSVDAPEEPLTKPVSKANVIYVLT